MGGGIPTPKKCPLKSTLNNQIPVVQPLVVIKSKYQEKRRFQ